MTVPLLHLTLVIVVMSFPSLADQHSACPESCSCGVDPSYPAGLRVNCSHANLHEVPEDIPVSTTTLLLAHNHLNVIRNNSFRHHAFLKHLNLSFNDISQVEKDAFVGLGQLYSLCLRNNYLPLRPTTYPQLVFQPLVSLQILHLTRMYVPKHFDRPGQETTPESILPSQLEDSEVSHRSGDAVSLARIVGRNRRQASSLSAQRAQSPTSATNLRVTKEVELDYPDEALSRLPSLRQLYIDGLANRTFGPGFLSLTNLSTLSLSGKSGYCGMSTLTRETFANVPHVQRLNLSDCVIVHLAPDTFSSVKSLRDLDLSFNQALGFDDLGDAFEGLSETRLENLTIDAIVPDKVLGLTINSTHLRHFKNLRYLEKLSVRFNRIEAFENGVLCTSVPPNLTQVYLNANLLELAPYVNDIDCLQSLELLHINGFDDYWTPPLRPPDSADQSDEGWTSSCMEQCVRSDSQYRQAADHREKTRQRQSFGSVEKEFLIPPRLKIFKARHFGLFYKLERLRVSPNNTLMRIDMGENHFPVWSGRVTGLENLTELYLEDTFTSDIRDDFFASFPSLEILAIAGNRLRSAFRNDLQGRLLRGLRSLRILDISQNDLGSLRKHTLEGLHNLKRLYARVNGMAYFDCNISHMENIQHLDFSQNQLNTLPKWVRDHLDSVAERHNVSVNMTYNPIACTCQNIDFLRWIRGSKVDFGTHENYYCLLADGSLKPMSDILGTIENLERTCGSYVGVFVGAVASSLLLLVLLVVTLAYRFRWKLRYLYYATRLSFQRNKRHHDDGFKFDAFVSFAGEDMEFVDGELKEELEEGRGLKLCIHERDFVPGQYIASNIVDSVQRSRRTLVVLTRALLASDWCHYELQMALMEAAETGRDVLLFLLYEHVPSHELPREVLFNIQAASYIEFPHTESDRDLFWDRLADALRR
ncbi:hypothetical protein BaRGS_00026192 [Batillaria attramentaria]|uniref:TIR domain-containing protein n=1 Tax=Batillaria attramentaria TaxID=370345 RepID=A0ABD0K6K0_9CAEN